MKRSSNIYRTIFIGVMAAVVCVVTFFRIPFLGSKVHFANAMCLLSGLLFGPVGGGLAAGIGSALYDALFGGYNFIECMITFVSKFAMALVCALLARGAIGEKKNQAKIILACIIGALTYVALYMLKTLVFQYFVYGLEFQAALVVCGTKLPASLINALFAMIVTPIIYNALEPALRKAGVLNKI